MNRAFLVIGIPAVLVLTAYFLLAAILIGMFLYTRSLGAD